MRIAHLPLDSRPCNLLFPGQLAAWCGHECLIPKACEMDDFTRPAAFEHSQDFLLRAAKEADALVISVDHLCMGSLLGSRSDDVPKAEALRRLEWLHELHALYPALPIYAYSMVMRSSISTLYAGDLNSYQAMTEYSVYSDRFRQTGDPEDAQRAQAAKDRLPEAVLRRYLLARERNHAVNLRCVQLTAEGVFASLALLQEDAETYGFHKAEQRALLAEKARLGCADVWLHNGADEGGAITVMKAIARCRQLPPVDVQYLGWHGGDFVASYEDRPFCQNVESMLHYAGLRTQPGAQTVLAVCCPPDGKQTDWENPACEAGYLAQARAIAQLMQAGKHVYLLDQNRANGGSLALMRAVHSHLPTLPLAGYSAWNTACNALGTAIAQIISDSLAEKTNSAFLWERLLDDLAYQSAVRGQMYEALQAAGEDPFHIADREAAQRLLEQRMMAFTRSEPLFARVPPHSVRLPWPRAFEAECKCL